MATATIICQYPTELVEVGLGNSIIIPYSSAVRMSNECPSFLEKLRGNRKSVPKLPMGKRQQGTLGQYPRSLPAR